MRIKDVADAVGVSTQTIRFYERKGLMPPPHRQSNGYRDYEPSSLNQLRFIRSAQAAGLTLVEIAGILDLRRDGTTPCTHVRSLLATKLDAVRSRQRELAGLEAELERLIGRSTHLDPADCTDPQICHIIAANEQRRTRVPASDRPGAACWV